MRHLTCTRCQLDIQVHEEPREFIDPARYICGACLKPAAGQTSLLDQPQPETHGYDPELAAIPY